MTRAADPPHFGQVVGAVALWATLLLGLGSIAQGTIALLEMVLPGHHRAGGVGLGLVDIAVGGLVGLPAVLQSKWLSRPANSASGERSWNFRSIRFQPCSAGSRSAAHGKRTPEDDSHY